jgi:zinc protease
MLLTSTHYLNNIERRKDIIMNKTIRIIQLSTGLFLLQAVGLGQTTREINYEGLKIIYKKIPKQVVTASLFIRGGVANITDEQQGLEALSINLITSGGTKSIDKNAFSDLEDKLGTNFSTNASNDYSSVTMQCLDVNFDKSWEMFAEALMNPAMDSNEFTLLKQQMISSARQQDANPDSYLRKLAIQQIFSGTPYGRIPNGTPESLDKLTLDQVKAYYAQLLGKKRCYLVIIGNLDEKKLLEKIKGTLAKLPDGSLPAKPVVSGVTKSGVNIKDRSIATNYIIGSVNGPKYFTPDGPMFEFAMSIIADRYFVELRTKRSLSYAPAAFYNKSLVNNPLSQLYITTVDPKQSLQVMVDIVNDVKKNGFTAKEVEDKKKQYLTRYFMTNEASASQAGTLGFCEASGSWKIFDEINNKIDLVRKEDLDKVFSKYMNTVAWTYLGKKDKVTEDDFKQPEPTNEKLPSSKVIKEKKE